MSPKVGAASARQGYKKKNSIDLAAMCTLRQKRCGSQLDFSDGVRQPKHARIQNAGSSWSTDEESVELSDGSSSSGSHDPLRAGKESFANRVEQMCEEKFCALTEDVRPSRDNMRKALAAILIEREAGAQLEVIALATGTKCVPRKEFTCDTLIDCHAEVLARRAFKKYLYNQLHKCTEGAGRQSNESIFTCKPNGKFGLKEGIRFHLYVSTTPCGDAREFCNKDKVTRVARRDNHPNRQKRGKGRCKLDCGDGSVLAEHYGKEGDRYVTMSCSDKIAQWNVVGLQGALLSLFLEEPIYLSLVVVGWLFSNEHLKRALYSRISKVKDDIARPFTINKPVMVNPPREVEFYQPNKTSRYSIAWSFPDDNYEKINTSTGNLESATGRYSKLTKRNFYDNFLSLWDSLASPEVLKLATSRLQVPAYARRRVRAVDIRGRVAYCDLKQLATGYQEAKRVVHEHYNSCLGAWVEHGEVDHFML